MTPTGRTANVLGAVSQVITDQTANAVAAATGQSPTAASALSALAEFLGQPTVDGLRGVLGLTPSGAVRLVDRLAGAGLVTRQAGSDGRSRAIVLTDRGRKVADQIAATRLAALGGMLEGLPAEELETLHSLLGRVLDTIVQAKSGGAWICRQCDFQACERSAGRCPVAPTAPAAPAAPTAPARAGR